MLFLSKKPFYRPNPIPKSKTKKQIPIIPDPKVDEENIQVLEELNKEFELGLTDDNFARLRYMAIINSEKSFSSIVSIWLGGSLAYNWEKAMQCLRYVLEKNNHTLVTVFNKNEIELTPGNVRDEKGIWFYEAEYVVGPSVDWVSTAIPTDSILPGADIMFAMIVDIMTTLKLGRGFPPVVIPGIVVNGNLFPLVYCFGRTLYIDAVSLRSNDCAVMMPTYKRVINY